METISVKNAISSRFPNVDLSRGIIGSLRHDFYEAHPEAFPYKSIKALLKTLDWPQDYMYAGTHPDDRALEWTNAVNGVTHDQRNWFITQADAKPWEPVEGIEIHPPGYTRCTLWKIPVGDDLDHDLDVDDLPNGVIRRGKPPSAEFKDYDHFGCLDCCDGRLYVAVEAAEFEHVPKVLVFDADTLSFVSSADLATQGNQHAPWCAINPLNGLLYSSSGTLNAHNGYLHIYRREWVENQLTLHRYHDSFELYDEQGHRITEITNVQCGTFSRDGQLYLLVDSKDENAGVHGFDLVSGRRTLFRHMEYKEDQELEAVTIWDLESGTAPHISGQLHVFVRSNDAFSYDDIFFRHFREIRGQSLAFERPRIVRPRSDSDQDLSDHFGLSAEVNFRYLGETPEPGQPGAAEETKFTLVTYNIAQVPAPGYEGSRDRYENIRDIARLLNTHNYDIVCIQEAFQNDAREMLINAVGTTYPHHVLGPQGLLLEQDSGLLILSRFLIISKHVHKFEEGAGLENFVAKGILHARIQIGSELHQTIDVFTSHTQSGAGHEEKRIRGGQLLEARKFIKTHRIQGCWILAGDLNVTGNKQQPSIHDVHLDDYPGLESEYDGMMSLLEPLRPKDLWTAFYQIADAPGYTFDATRNNFTGSTSGSSRERLDYILVPL